MQLFRPFDNVFVETVANFTTHDPIIPYGVFAVNADGSGFKLGDGVNTWSNLTYQGGNSIGSKQVQTSREPANNELLLFCESTDKWIYRLQHCFDTVTNWESNTSVFPTSTLLIETANLTSIPTGRFKIGDGSTTFDNLPWFGADFATSDFSVGESIEFNGTYFEPVTYLKPTELQSATTPTGLFHRDDGTWAEMTVIEHLDSIESDYASFGTVYVGGFPTESTTVTLTSDGTDLFSDGNKVWTQYNDGTGSGLDADTLDGHHSTAFPTTPATGVAGNLVAFGASPNILVDSGVSSESTGSTTFISLTDTPLTYSGHANAYVRVNAGTNALEFATISTGDTFPSGSIGDLLVCNGGTTWEILSSPATAGYVLTSNGTGNKPSWEPIQV